MLERIHAILIKEFLQTLRDPRMCALLILVPIIQSILFGYAVTTDVKQIALGVMDIDNTPESRELISNFKSSGYFKIQPICVFRRPYSWSHGSRIGQSCVGNR